MCLAFVLGALAFPAASLGAAWFIDTPTLFIAAGALAAWCVTSALTLLALWLFARKKNYPLALGIGGGAALVMLIAFSALFLKPLVPGEEQYSIDIPDDVELWTLDTGSTIAVRKRSARGVARSHPIVFLHGGPGAYSVSLAQTVEPHSALRNDGHDVYFYDQVGGGISARLDDIADYSLERHLADLNAVFRRIGSDKMILIGSSFGATLAANYMAQHPEHVIAAVFSGAGPIFHPHWVDNSDGGLDERLSATQRKSFKSTVETPRLFAALALAEINPRAAARFATDTELGSVFDRVANQFYLGHAVCDPARLQVESAGYGFWSNRMTGKTLWNRHEDPRTALRNNRTPVLVLRGECDYKNEAVAREYVDVFPNSRFHSFEDAGHMIYWEQPDSYLRRIRQFLAEVAN